MSDSVYMGLFKMAPELRHSESKNYGNKTVMLEAETEE